MRRRQKDPQNTPTNISERKIAQIFLQIRTLPEEASIHTAEMTAIKVAFKEIQKRKDKRWVIYTDSQSSMQAMETNKENHSILNQIYNVLLDLQKQIHL